MLIATVIVNYPVSLYALLLIKSLALFHPCHCPIVPRYRFGDHDVDIFTVTDVFEKYMMKNTEPFLFYCSVPPYTRKMFGGTEHSLGFLEIQWAEMVYIILLRGNIRYG